MLGRELIQHIIENNLLEVEFRTASSGDDLNVEEGYEISGFSETENDVGEPVAILLVE